MRTIRPLTLVLAISLLFALTSSAPAAAPHATAAKRKSCGTYASTSVYKRARVIAIRRVSCKRALQVAKAYDKKGWAPRPWQCGLAHSDLPRLFSCGAGAPTRGSLTRRKYAFEVVGSGRRR